MSNGGIQFNQTRPVAAVAAHRGLKCVLTQENWINDSDAVYEQVGNIEMSRIVGADGRLDAAGFDIGGRQSWNSAMDDVRRAGMVVGFAANGRGNGEIGIDASAKPVQSREQILRIAKYTAKRVEVGREITEADGVLDTRFGGPEYGLPNEGTLEAIRLYAR